MNNNDFDVWIDEQLPRFELLSKYVAFIIENQLLRNGIDFLSVDFRTKTKDGILEKNKRKEYSDPIVQLTDISGIRVILYFETDIERVCDIIKKTFNIDSNNSIDNNTRLATDKIGYRSIHYVCDVGEDRARLDEYAFIGNLKCEIQVRTMLQHAWAELTHDRNYKLGANLPNDIQRKINLYSGMLELADYGFSEVIESIRIYQEQIKSGTVKVESQPINSFTLLEFVDNYLNSIGLGTKDSDRFPESRLEIVIKELEFMGINSFEELSKLIPENYKQVATDLNHRINAIGFCRELMLIHDFRKLREYPNLQWYISKDEKSDLAFFSNFMSKNEAKELMSKFEYPH